MCDQLRRAQVASIIELAEPEHRQQCDLLRSLVTHRRRALSTPADEQTRDRWDLTVFGHRGSLDFTVLDQTWLRETAKRWVADDVHRRRGQHAANLWQYMLASLTELGTSLRLQRDDHGAVPARLGRADMVAFTQRLAFLAQTGELSANRRIDVLRHVRTVLAAARWQGLTRPGEAAAGLPDGFTLVKEDIPAKDRGDSPGRALPAEILRRLCQGLPAVASVTTCQDAGTAIELLIDTGRRPEEICDLPFDCLTRDGQGKYVLIWNNIKCGRSGRELPITDATASLIVAQQQRVRARFPDTPTAQLRLLPAPKMNRTAPSRSAPPSSTRSTVPGWTRCRRCWSPTAPRRSSSTSSGCSLTPTGTPMRSGTPTPASPSTCSANYLIMIRWTRPGSTTTLGNCARRARNRRWAAQRGCGIARDVRPRMPPDQGFLLRSPA